MDWLIIPLLVLFLFLLSVFWRIYLIHRSIRLAKKVTQLVQLWKDRRMLLIQFIHLEYLNEQEKDLFWSLLNRNPSTNEDRIRNEKALTHLVFKSADKMTLRILANSEQIKKLRQHLFAQEIQLNEQLHRWGSLKRLLKVEPIRFFSKEINEY